MPVNQSRPVVKLQTTAEWLNQSLNSSSTPASDIARRIGISANMISIWRSGRQPIPYSRLGKLAQIFGADPVFIRNLRFQEDGWDSWLIDEKERQMPHLTESEHEFLDLIRSSNVENPKMNEEDKERFKEFLSTLKSSIYYQEVKDEE